jgi:hypothetical protein
MSPIRRIALLIAALATLGALTASAASASLPALYQCGAAVKVGKTYTGHYTAKTCTAASKVETGGKYELEEWRVGSKETGGKKGKVKAFKGKTKQAANLVVVGQSEISCAKGAADEGKFTGPKTAELSVTFQGCETQGLKCTNTATAGEVKTNLLEAEVGYISGKGTEHPVIGAAVGAKAPGINAAEFHCSNLFIAVHGFALGEVLPVDVNKFTKSATFAFTQHTGVPTFEKFEEGPVDRLITEECFEKACEGKGGKDPSAEEISIENKGEELELKA